MPYKRYKEKKINCQKRKKNKQLSEEKKKKQLSEEKKTWIVRREKKNNCQKRKQMSEKMFHSLGPMVFWLRRQRVNNHQA